MKTLLLLAGVALLSIAGWAPLASAQSHGLTVNVAGFSAPGWPSPQAVVTVQDGQGHALGGLVQSDFQAQLNGSPVPLTSVTRAVDSSLPIAVVLALDTSGSMQGAALDQAKAAAHRFLDGLSPQDSVAVYTFSDSAELRQPFTQDRAAAAAAIDGLGAAGETALFQATADSLRLAASASSSRRAVVILSDGVDHGSVLPRADAIATAGALGVPVFAIGLGSGIDRDYLRELAAASGGQFAETPSPDGLAQLYQNVAEALRGQYVLTLDASSLDLALSAAAMLRIDITAGGAAGGGERLVCPQAACISLADLQDGQRVVSARTVTAEVVAQDAVSSVTFLVDGQAVQQVHAPPYELTLDPSAYSGGGHKLAVQVTSASGATAAKEISVRLGAAKGDFAANSVLLGVGALIFVAVAGLGWFFVRRRSGHEPKSRPVSPAPAPQKPGTGIVSRRLSEDFQPLPPTLVDEPMGVLRAVGGPLQGGTFAVGAMPVSIGSGMRCPIRLEEMADGAEIPPEYARVWVRDGKLMVHEVRRLTLVGAVGGGWEVLGKGDVFSVGPYTFQFDLEPEADEAAYANDTTSEAPAAPKASEPPAVVGEDAAAVHDEPERAADAAPVPNILRQPGGPKEQIFAEPVAPAPNIEPERAADAAPVPNILRQPGGPKEQIFAEPVAPAPNIEPERAADASPPVPNILRQRGGPKEQIFAGPAAPAPNILRDPTASPGDVSDASQDAIPNVLRDRPAAAANGAAEPPDDALDVPQPEELGESDAEGAPLPELPPD